MVFIPYIPFFLQNLLLILIFLVPGPTNKTETHQPLPTTSTSIPMHNTNGKIVRAVTTTAARSEVRPLTLNGELNGNNIIFLKGAKATNGTILLRADALNTTKTSLVLDEGDSSKLGQIFIQQGDLGEGVILQSVKRLGGGAPIFLLSGNDNGNSHILIETTSTSQNSLEETQQSEFVEETGQDNILVQALEGIKDTAESITPRSVSTTPLGSGELPNIEYNTEILNVIPKY